MTMIAAASPFDWNNVFIFLIAALAAWNTYRSRERDKVQKEQKEEVKAVAKKADAIIGKAEELHTLTNGNLSRTVAALEVANATIKGLQDVVAAQTSAKISAEKVADRAAEPKTESLLSKPTKVEIVNTPKDPVPVKQAPK